MPYNLTMKIHLLFTSKAKWFGIYHILHEVPIRGAFAITSYAQWLPAQALRKRRKKEEHHCLCVLMSKMDAIFHIPAHAVRENQHISHMTKITGQVVHIVLRQVIIGKGDWDAPWLL